MRKYKILLFISSLFFISIVLAQPISTHLNIQTTDNSGNILTGTFNFFFNISTTSNCNNVIYSNSVLLTTDSRGIISYYLPNTDSLNFNQDLYFCYYRDGILKNNTLIGAIPYAYFSKNTTYWGGMNSTNSTQFSNNNGVLNLANSWLTTFINSFNFITSWLVPSTTNGYLYNDSTNIYFNDTKLNNNFCYSNGTNCQVSSMNYTNITMLNQNNNGNLTINGTFTSGNINATQNISLDFNNSIIFANNGTIRMKTEPAGKTVLEIKASNAINGAGANAVSFPGYVIISNNPYQTTWDANYRLSVGGSYGTGYNNGIYSAGYSNVGGASSIGVYADSGCANPTGTCYATGLQGRAYYTGTGTANALIGLNFLTQVYGAGNVTLSKSINAIGGVYNNNKGTLFTGIGINLDTDMGNGSIKTYTGLKITTPYGLGGTITNWTSIELQDVPNATNVRGIVIDSNILDIQLGHLQQAKISYNGSTLLINSSSNTFSGTIATANASSYTNQVVCYLAGGQLGHCTSVVGVTGSCTCVAN